MTYGSIVFPKSECRFFVWNWKLISSIVKYAYIIIKYSLCRHYYWKYGEEIYIWSKENINSVIFYFPMPSSISWRTLYGITRVKHATITAFFLSFFLNQSFFLFSFLNVDTSYSLNFSSGFWSCKLSWLHYWFLHVFLDFKYFSHVMNNANCIWNLFNFRIVRDMLARFIRVLVKIFITTNSLKI